MFSEGVWSLLILQKIDDNQLEICMDHKVVQIDSIVRISVLSERQKRNFAWGINQNWYIETLDEKTHLVSNYSTVIKDLKKLLKKLIEINPSILLDDSGLMFLDHKVFDRTTRKSMIVADKFASFRNPMLDPIPLIVIIE